MKLWNYEAFVLDLDGTLIDSGKYHARAFADAVQEQSGYMLTADEHHEFFAMHSTWFSTVLNKRHGLSLKPESVLAQKRKRVEEIFVAELFSGARDFLERWYGKKPMALATNSPLSFVQSALKKADVMKYFECITTADDVVNRKPDPEVVEVSIQRLQADPLNTLVFEDQLIGIEAARAAGAKVIAVDNGQPVNYPVDVAVYNWSELLKLSEMR
ncbi:HAD family hydrolase [Pontiella sulfatireligans]|uniref:phosphoglycolate phosphatase n=1 Tax=Pontiella sulfatireligans TaxID=2750658 RepID=A0A6C2UF04_9BACT|nr:HAD family phosphatase [Pontiella sulfatireligans]VGO18499.1 Fructose-1-phosphate phosphatase YqaB [Pontiella sulfatireligans]